MIQEKTRGNLTNEEATVLRNTLSNLQMAFVEVSQQSRAAQPPRQRRRQRTRRSTCAEPAAEQSEPEPSAGTPQAEPESRKKFTKSYGA